MQYVHEQKGNTQNETIKQPLTLVATGLTELLIIGTALGWFTVGNELTAGLVDKD